LGKTGKIRRPNMRQKLFVLILCVISVFLYQERLFAYSLAVHKQITIQLIDQNKQVLNNYLKNIGLSNGVDEPINKKKVREWIEEGSWKEDFNWSLLNNPLFSHFYNPLTNKSGVGVLWPSAYEWADSQNNEWSWKMARDYLTLTTKTERENALAKAFKAIGHVMHLVQDVGTPAHTRGDLHISDPYEKYTNKNIGSLSYTSVPFPYWNLSISPNAPRQFWDLDSYNGSMPYGSGYIGLSEYTNANFASSDTIFSETLLSSSPLYFPFPRKSSSILYEGTNSQGKKTKYFKIIKESENINHFAVAGRFYDIFEGLPNVQRLFISLDDKCHDDYQNKLIPRAVGYSAGLLNYFFRGEMEAVNFETIKDGSGNIKDIKMKVKNNTPNEAMSSTEQGKQGKLIVSYQYKNLSGDEVYGLSSEVLVDEVINSGKESISEFTFTFIDSNNSPSPIPSNAKDIRYWLVYRGKLGKEEDAVVGKEIKEKEFVFLVNLKNQTAVFEIKPSNNQYQLIPASKNINIKKISSGNTLLTVQSHPNKGEHVVALPYYWYDRYGNMVTTYSPNIAKYGRRVHYFTDYLGYAHYFTIGFPQAYIPKNFNDDKSPYVWDSNFIYGEGVWTKVGYYWKSRLASYIHGRRPFSIVNNKLEAKNINIRKSDGYTYYGDDYSGPFHIQWKDETGNWVRGMDLPDKTTYLAVLDKDKTIHITNVSDTSQSPSSSGGGLKGVYTTTYKYYDNYCERTYTMRREDSYTIKGNGVNNTSDIQSTLVAGDTVVEAFITKSESASSGEFYITDYAYSYEKIYDSNPGCALYQGYAKAVDSTRQLTISGDTVTRTIRVSLIHPLWVKVIVAQMGLF
jgi:hypothetical protein